MHPIAHVGGPVFEPLQVAVLTLVATAYSLRMLTLARGRDGRSRAGGSPASPRGWR